MRASRGFIVTLKVIHILATIILIRFVGEVAERLDPAWQINRKFQMMEEAKNAAGIRIHDGR